MRRRQENGLACVLFSLHKGARRKHTGHVALFTLMTAKVRYSRHTGIRCSGGRAQQGAAPMKTTPPKDNG